MSDLYCDCCGELINLGGVDDPAEEYEEVANLFYHPECWDFMTRGSDGGSCE